MTFNSLSKRQVKFNKNPFPTPVEAHWKEQLVGLSKMATSLTGLSCRGLSLT